MRMHWYIIFPFLLMMDEYVVAQYVTPTGPRFRHMLGFMGNKHGGDTALELAILNPNENITNVTICFARDLLQTSTAAGITPRLGGLINPRTMKTVSLPSTLAVNMSVKCENGIRIDSDYPTFVYGTNRQLSHQSMDEFVSIPRRKLGNLYYAVTGRRRPQILVVGLYANTSLDIHIRATSGVSYQSRTYSSGQTISETMKEFDTIQIVSKKFGDDLTGTEIKTSKPVSVFSGSRFSWSSYLAEQMPTVADWGVYHVITPPAEDFLYNTTIVAAFPNTIFNFSCCDGSEKLITLAKAGSFKHMNPSNVTCFILTTRPVLVSIEIYSFNADTSMTIIQPMKRVLRDLVFYAPENIYMYNLVVVTYCNISLTLDQEYLDMTRVDGHFGVCIGRVHIITGIHTIRSSGHAFFLSGYIHGTLYSDSTAFPLVPIDDEVGGQYVDGEISYTSRDNTKATVTTEQSAQNEPMAVATDLPPRTPTPSTIYSETTTTNASRTRPHGLCQCTCSETHRDIDSALSHMRAELSVNRNMTSKHMRSRTSAADDRTSSRMIGLTASVCFGVVAIIVLILDSIHLAQMVRRIRRCSV